MFMNLDSELDKEGYLRFLGKDRPPIYGATFNTMYLPPWNERYLELLTAAKNG